MYWKPNLNLSIVRWPTVILVGLVYNKMCACESQLISQSKSVHLSVIIYVMVSPCILIFRKEKVMELYRFYIRRV